MQFLAFKHGSKFPPEYDGKYNPKPKREVKCAKEKCDVQYSLYAPLMEQEKEIVDKQEVWLRDYITKRHAEHEPMILTLSVT